MDSLKINSLYIAAYSHCIRFILVLKLLALELPQQEP
jgi:hypothetical protein